MAAGPRARDGASAFDARSASARTVTRADLSPGLSAGSVVRADVVCALRSRAAGRGYWRAAGVRRRVAYARGTCGLRVCVRALAVVESVVRNRFARARFGGASEARAGAVLVRTALAVVPAFARRHAHAADAACARLTRGRAGNVAALLPVNEAALAVAAAHVGDAFIRACAGDAVRGRAGVGHLVARARDAGCERGCVAADAGVKRVVRNRLARGHVGHARKRVALAVLCWRAIAVDPAAARGLGNARAADAAGARLADRSGGRGAGELTGVETAFAV